MPRAEVGSTKYVANKMKSKGLQRLRWYCQACERQMRDENGFKCHVASESHVRQMMLIGEDPRRAISDFSNQFQRDFVQLLRTGHGEKKVNVNHFYQEYISNKEHVHMNATRWASLTEFAKHLGREGICRVEEDEKNEGRTGASGLCISWIDNSPEALRRQDALRKKERQDRGDEEREQRLIQQQIRKAKREGNSNQYDDDDDAVSDTNIPISSEGIKRKDGEKIRLNFGTKKNDDLEKPPSPPLTDKEESSEKEDSETRSNSQESDNKPKPTVESKDTDSASKPSFKMSMSTSKPKNVFAAASQKNAFGGVKKTTAPAAQRPMSAAERIMKEELERKRQRELNGGNVFKKQRVS